MVSVKNGWFGTWLMVIQNGVQTRLVIADRDVCEISP